ncbi:MAG: hypothetical protein L0H63_13080 [Nitrococcus sp.]|nr:hypothetical protein [Nitrococcus sp.]
MRNSLIRFTMASALITSLCLLALPFKAEARMGLGYFDSDNLTRRGDNLSALYSVNKDWAQAFFGVYNTNDGLSFSIGGAYKFTVLGDQKSGLHIGPGLAMGTVNDKFLFSAFGLAGFHYTVFDRVMLSVDGGPILTLVDDEVDFSLEPAGNLLGLSIHYLF